MSQSLSNRDLTTPDNLDVIGRPQMAKATTTHRNGVGKLSDVVSEAAKQSHGKQGAAAAQLGKDEGNFARDLKAGRITLGQLEGLGDEFLAALGRELQEQYGALANPKDRTRRVLRNVIDLLREVEQFVEDVS